MELCSAHVQDVQKAFPFLLWGTLCGQCSVDGILSISTTFRLLKKSCTFHIERSFVFVEAFIPPQ